MMITLDEMTNKPFTTKKTCNPFWTCFATKPGETTTAWARALKVKVSHLSIGFASAGTLASVNA